MIALGNGYFLKLFYEIGTCFALSSFIKNPPGDRTAAYNVNVAGATAAGEEFRKRNSYYEKQRGE